MLAAEEMGTKGVRAMTPLETTLANALRVKLGKGRDLPEEPKPKRPARAKTAAPAEGDAEGELKKVAHPRKKATGEDEAAPVEVRPAATIVKPKPAEPTEAPEPLAPVAEVVVETKPPVVVPPPVLEPPAPPKPVGTPAPPVVTPPPPVSRPATPPRPEPKIVPYRPLERPAAPPPSRPGPRQPFAPPRVVSAPPRPPAPPREIRPPQPAREPVRPAAAAAVAEKMRRKSGEVIKALLELGVMRMVNDLLDPTEAKLVGDKFGFDVEIRSVEGEVIEEEEAEGGQLSLRPPVVTVMGHVDHGKTSLLDAIRKSKVAEKEFGGITQHIGAYQVATSHGKVTFLDTPGHEAFTAMRARGAQATDIVILVVAADDGVMPQTVEAINHARAANVPIIVAVNKVDKPEADPDRVKRELSNHNLVPEDWGGQTIYVPTSAKKGTGIEQLLEMSALQAEILELKANPNRAAKGVVIESRLDRGRGPVATVLVQTGTLKEGDAVVVGANSGRIRALLDAGGRKVKSAGPSDPVEILGLSGVPSAGDVLVAVSDERKARQIATMRADKEKAKVKAATRITLEGLHQQIKTGEVKELRLVLKADVQGSVEALTESLERLSTEEVKLKVIHSSVGAIIESDVMLASASNAIVLGFNVKPEAKAAQQAQANGVDVRMYNVIYEAINDVRAALAGMLAPEIRETLLGRALVRQIFVISKLGPIAGSYVQEGKFVRTAKVRVRRGDSVVGTGTVGSLKRFKDDVREVLAGLECGIGVDGVNGVQAGDLLEAFTTEEVARTL
ncbi:MAG: translation initiation factor IF-2 [Candidatus Rokubacteria bacterium 13_1_20CM_4_68_9]|nr:MAG: translation initiation factor IF-2 [Candidatus Rokubacteria bacterium 13_1_20CM_4_68_9]